MASAGEFDVSRFIDERRLNRFNASLVIWSFFLVLFDGYDITGITFGGAVPGAISVWLVPQYGWQAIFAVGGVLPILMAVGAALQLPESLKHVVVRDDRAQADRLLALLKPDRAPDAATRLVVADEKVYRGFNPKYLFADGLALITPLLWICFACNLMGFYFLLSWLPTLLTGAKLPPSEAAIATALVQIGGTVGGLALARPIDAKGFLPVTILFACSVLAVGALGYVGLASATALMAIVFLAGFCVLGLQFGLNAASAMIYPTSVRSNGSGWAFGVGRVGSVLGPVVGGVLIGMKMPLQELFLWATVPFIVGAVACGALTRLYVARFGTYALRTAR